MAAVYATVEDVTTLIRPLTAEEQDRAAALLPIASAKLRQAAKKRGRDLDGMIAAEPDIGDIAKEITCKAVVRSLDSSADDMPPASQASQSALGYSVSMTYINSGQSLYFLRNELKELGLLRQRFGVLEVYDVETDD